MLSKQTFTTGEIAEYCGVTFRTVIRWVDRGELKGYELPGRGDKRIEAEDFLAFLKKNNIPIPSDLSHYLKRVLIFEDDALMAKSIQRILHRVGFETLIATNGFHAGTLIGTFLPSVMTLDLNMPGVNGYQLLKTIRENENLKYLKVLVISAASTEELEETFNLGANDILQKPIRSKELIEKITTLSGLKVSPQLT